MPVSYNDVYKIVVQLWLSTSILYVITHSAAYDTLYPCGESKPVELVMEIVAHFAIPLLMIGLYFIAPKNIEEFKKQSQTDQIVFICAVTGGLAASFVILVLNGIRQLSGCDGCPNKNDDPFERTLGLKTEDCDDTFTYNYFFNAKSYCNLSGACVDSTNSPYSEALDKSYCTYACPTITYLPLNYLFQMYSIAYTGFVTIVLVIVCVGIYTNQSTNKPVNVEQVELTPSGKGKPTESTLHAPIKLRFPRLVQRTVNPTSRNQEKWALLAQS